MYQEILSILLSLLNMIEINNIKDFNLIENLTHVLLETLKKLTIY
jgi:hypothetical protein